MNAIRLAIVCLSLSMLLMWYSMPDGEDCIVSSPEATPTHEPYTPHYEMMPDGWDTNHVIGIGLTLLSIDPS